MIKKHVVMGLHGAGKTTFAAALWHLIESKEVATVLDKGVHRGDYSYLEEIAKYWSDGWCVPRTEGTRVEPIQINLINCDDDSKIGLEFVDLSGETFERAFATRELYGVLPSLLSNMDGLLLFVSAVRKDDSLSLLDLGVAAPEVFSGEGATSNEPEKEFNAADVPQQVQIVDLLQAWTEAPIEKRPKRLVVIVSAWDISGLKNPDNWLSKKMPLLDQFLRSHQEEVPFRVYGVSAQGGKLTKKEDGLKGSDRDKLIKLPKASERIQVVGHDAGSHDLTHPIKWLSEL